MHQVVVPPPRFSRSGVQVFGLDKDESVVDFAGPERLNA